MEDFLKLKIRDYNYWTIYLHSNQYYLGRCVLWCKRDIIDFFEMNELEREELYEVGKNLRDVLRNLFKLDLMNYAALGNFTPHLHIHFIPRYKEKRAFENHEFIDERWGKNPNPTPEFSISEGLLLKIKDKIKESL